MSEDEQKPKVGRWVLQMPRQGRDGFCFCGNARVMPKVERAVKIVQPLKECLEEMAACWAVECEFLTGFCG